MTNSELGARDRSTAIGFATNVAARIQALAEPGTVVVSETAVEAISPYFELEPVGPRHLRGVSQDVEVFRVYEPRARSTMRDDRLGVLLVGREEERRRIEAAWRSTVEGGGGSRVVVVTGEPGIGKSRLARYAMDVARQDGADVIEINCGHDFRHVGLGAVRRGIEKALELGSTPRPGQTRAALEARARLTGLPVASVRALATLMGDAGDGSPTAELAPDRLREAIIGALQEWVAAEALVSPVVLVVEDLHWADDTAVEALRRLTAGPPPPGLLVLMTVRTGEAPGPLEHLLEHAIELRPLAGADASELVRSFAGGGDDLDEEAVEALARRGEGVPLFTEHLVMAAAHPAPGHVPADALPATLEGLLQVRLASSGPGRALAEVAAVIGREFSLDLVERVLAELGDGAPLPPTAVASGLRALQRAGLVEPSGEGTVRFRHVLVRDVAYELQLRAERPRRHRAVARAIVSLHGPDASPEGLARHLEQAGDLAPAASAYLRAAEGAAGLAEFDIALAHLRAAGSLITRVEGPEARRLELAHCMQTGSVSAASFSYAREEGERAYLRAMELCDLIATEEGPDVGLDVQLIAALGGLWSKEVVAGDLRAARAVSDRLERLLSRAPADLGPEIRRFLLACRGFEQLFTGATGDALATLREASQMPSGPVTVPLGAPHDYVAAVDALLAVALVLAGDDPGADEALARALRRTTQLPFPVGPFSEAVVQVYAAYLNRLRGDVEGARAAARVVSEIGDRHGFREHAMLGQVLGLAASTMEGDQAACEALENVLGIWRMTGGGLAVPVLLAELADGCLRAGDLERARSALDDAATMMAQTDQRGSESEVLRIAALLDRAGGAAPDGVVKGLVASAEAALACGSLRLAARAVHDALDVLDGRPDDGVVDIAGRLQDRLPPSAAWWSAGGTVSATSG